MSAPFQIRNDVAMPGTRNRYPFDTMEVGASFEIVGEAESSKVRNAAYQFSKKKNKDAAVAQAREILARPLTREERAEVSPLHKNDPGAMDFALRKIGHVDARGNKLPKDAKAPEGETYTPVYGLWRLS